MLYFVDIKLADHIVSNLHYLSCKYPDSALILGADKNSMDISPIIDSGLKLRQMVQMNTHGQKILDIIIMNTAKFYNSAVINPPINPIPYISNSKTVLEDTLSQKSAVVTLSGPMILLGIQSHKLIVSQIWIDARKNWL